MAIRRMEGSIKEVLPVQYVLVSVFDKSKLEELVPELIRLNPETLFVSTGGTGKKILELLDNPENSYMSVEDLTGTPPMEGGLVKTLTPGIHARLLGERNNPAHQQYLKEIANLEYGEGNEHLEKIAPAVGFFDLVVVNMYPFQNKAAEFPEKSTFEDVRDNIDIGGPAMVRAAAKNFPNTSVVVDPIQYNQIIVEIMKKGGISFETRKKMAGYVFRTTAEYDTAIADFFEKVDFEKDVRPCYTFERGE